MAAKQKKNAKYGKAGRKPSNINYTAAKRWLSNATKRAARQKKREAKQREHVIKYVSRKLDVAKRGGYIDDRGMSCKDLRKLVG